MSDERLREAYQRGLPEGNDRPALDDLSAERLRKLVDREGTEAERLHTIDGLLSSAEGRRELEITWAAARAARPVGRRLWWGIAAAAAVIIAVPTVYLATREPEVLLRGDESPIALVAPIGDQPVNVAERFVWRALVNADRYTIVVVDAIGNEVFAGDTRDTVLSLPDTVTLRTGATYLWWVQARTRTGETVTAVTQRVRVIDR
jgi:hypothetical protein